MASRIKSHGHFDTLSAAIAQFRLQGNYSDVILFCNGKCLPAHRIVLSSFSDYFRELFELIKYSQSVIVLEEMNLEDLEALLDFVYVGQVSVPGEKLASFMKAARRLKVKSLYVEKESDSTDSAIMASSTRPKRKVHEDVSLKSVCGDSNEEVGEGKTFTLQRKNKNLITKSIGKILRGKMRDLEAVPEQQKSIEEEGKTEGAEMDLDVKDENMKREIRSSRRPEKEETPRIQVDESSEVIPLEETAASRPTRMKTRNSSRNFFKCGSCNYQAKSNFHLVTHERTHTGEKPFKCEYCPYRATQMVAITNHVRVHFAKKPWQCSHCSFACKRKHLLIKHLRVHEAEQGLDSLSTASNVSKRRGNSTKNVGVNSVIIGEKDNANGDAITNVISLKNKINDSAKNGFFDPKNNVNNASKDTIVGAKNINDVAENSISDPKNNASEDTVNDTKNVNDAAKNGIFDPKNNVISKNTIIGGKNNGNDDAKSSLEMTSIAETCSRPKEADNAPNYQLCPFEINNIGLFEQHKETARCQYCVYQTNCSLLLEAHMKSHIFI